MRRPTTRRIFLTVASLALALGLSGRGQSDELESDMPAPGSTRDGGLRFRLSEGEAPTLEPRRIAPAAAAPLSEAESAAVLGRLQPLEAAEADKQEFALRKGSLPPPLTGQTVEAPFPPAEPGAAAAPTPEAGPLEVLRFAPEGEVPLAPHVSVSFSRPMVALGTLEQLGKLPVPVHLTPEVPGAWRWVGTKTVLFEPAAERLPMATEFSVEVPAGTTGAAGGTLAAAKSWTFKTPAPRVLSMAPQGGPHPRQPLLFLGFDQRIRPQDVLPTIHVEAGGRNFGVALVPAEEAAADAEISRLVEAAQEGRWLALKLAEPLPTASGVQLTVGPGTPSAEGPRRTAEAQSFGFSTYGPLEVVESYCGWQGGPCPPLTPWTVRFSNPLDAKALSRAQVRVEPELPGLKTAVNGAWLTIWGRSAGRTTYKLTLDAGIRDTFGQTLEKSVTLSFAVGSAPPSLSAPGGHFVVLDPTGGARWSVYSVNHRSLRVALYSVTPEDWPGFMKFMKDAAYDRRSRAEPPGRRVSATSVEVGGQPDELVETRLDLAAALKDGLGHAIVVVEPPAGWRALFGLPEGHDTKIIAWVQATRIGLDAFVDHGELLGWATSLADGKPLSGASLSLAPNGSSAETGADGLAVLPLPADSAPQTNLLVARSGPDVAFLPEHTSWWNERGGWVKSEPGDSLRWYVFDDRQMYRPGEEVHVKGWIRKIGSGREGDVGAVGKAAGCVRWQLNDSRGNEVLKGVAPLGSLAGFDLSLRLPDTMNLGYTRLELFAEGAEGAAIGLGGSQYTHSIQVQEFRRPEFEVSASASEGPHLVGGTVDVSVKAAYYAGGGLPGAEVSWSVTSTPGTYSPPNWEGFTFGTWVPWWGYGRHGFPSRSESRTETYSGRTDASGEHHLKVELLGLDPPQPMSLSAEASVMDVNRQAWAASATALVHPSEHYVGLRSERTFVEQGQPLEIEAILTDLDGKALAGRPIELRCVRQDWTFEEGEWRQTEESPQSRTLSSAAEPVRASFETAEGGTYKLTARIADDKGRKNQSELTLWVAGGKQPPQRQLQQEQVTLIPDRKEYRPGETAKILVQAPFAAAEGLLTLRRGGLLRHERFSMSGAATTLEVQLTEGHLPSLTVQVDLVGSAPRTDDSGKVVEALPKRPAFAAGSLSLPVSLASRTLSVAVQPREPALEPGGETEVLVQVRDASGKPVPRGEVAVAVVDEAVLALSGYKAPDLVRTFYTGRGADVRDYHLRSSVQLANPEDVVRELEQQGGEGGAPAGRADGMYRAARMKAAAAPQPMMAEATMALDEAGPAGPAIRVRSDFNPLAAFVPAVQTDAEGRARVPVKLPDNLTRYRIVALAVAGARQFGQAEGTLTARLPLMVRPSAPRFLNFGDRFELPVVVQNQTDAPISVDVALRATGVELLQGAGRRTSVPANDRVEVRFLMQTLHAGTARFQIGAASGRWADAAEVSIPVWTPATTEAFATYGELEGGTQAQPAMVVQPVQAPQDVFSQFGGLDVTTSSTQLQALTDAVLYLIAYPFECAEQISSRMLGVAALRDVLSAFQAEAMPAPEEIEASMKRDIERLRGLQEYDGGFAFWRRGDETWPYISIHVAHALQRAKEKGYEVPDEMLQRSKSYLQNVESHIPSWYGEQARRVLQAYALYVRKRLGDSDPAKARSLYSEQKLEDWSLEALGWLLPVLASDKGSQAPVAAILRHLDNRVAETAAAAHFVTEYGDNDYLLLHSNRRTDGILLEALIEVKPQSDLIPKLVRGLLDQRTRGRWSNTQENVFILLALDRYFAVFEKQTPDFVARVWLGDGYAGDHAFRGRTTERHHIEIPMRYLVQGAARKDLVLSKDGPGRLYYRLGVRYAPKSLKLDALDAGFTVQRAYEAVDGPQDVQRDPDGTWRVRAGAKVKVRLTMVAPARRTHVALVDPLPAGLEAMNPALAVTGSVPQGDSSDVTVLGGPGLGGPRLRGHWWWWRRIWFDHQNLRDERVEAFTSLLWEGVYTYTYFARATTPGTFVVPPPKAEEMYHPETFGRGATDRVIVE